jgi:hypothetical protein
MVGGVLPPSLFSKFQTYRQDGEGKQDSKHVVADLDGSLFVRDFLYL